MAYQLGTPFDNIESAREYVNQPLAATREAQAEIETELRRIIDPEVARREQALQLVKYKLSQLTSHLSSSHRILNDLTKLRRLLPRLLANSRVGTPVSLRPLPGECQLQDRGSTVQNLPLHTPAVVRLLA
jgi:hypothetical protein